MKKLLVLLSLLFLFFLSTREAFAIYDPTSVPNNRFGVHIVDTNDLKDIPQAVGEWGYVTLVIQKGERDTTRWQRVFDQMRRLKLIPIVRIATSGYGNNWEKPSAHEIDGWVGFLNSLNWVVKNRYIVVGNEPNHAKEWGGVISPEEYADYLAVFSKKLKDSHTDFFIMPAGMDAAAPNSRTTMDESLFLTRMVRRNRAVFDYVDGWSSHSYPSGFTGSEDGVGKGSVRSFAWELAYLKNLGVGKELPVFITETGWAHTVAGQRYFFVDPAMIGRKFEFAFRNAWNDKRVVAVTPFIFNYPDPPFDMFSWKKKDGSFYEFYDAVASIEKIQARPIQDNNLEIIASIVPPVGIVHQPYSIILFIKNTGQSILTKDNLKVIAERGSFEVTSSIPGSIEPGYIGVVFIKGEKLGQTQYYENNLQFEKDGEKIGNNFRFQIHVIKLSLSTGRPARRC